jgi:hypothetical protein
VDPPVTSPGMATATVTLSEWVARHGPLSPVAAFLIALEVCGRVSRLPPRQLGGAIQSLNLTHVIRGRHGGWTWTPVLDDAARSRVVTDTEIVERIAALTWHGLTGVPVTDPYADDDVLRSMLRSLRPDIPAVFSDLTVRAVSARSSAPRSLSTLASEMRRAVGLEAPAPTRPWRRAWRAGAALACGLSLLVVTALTAANADDRLEPHGFTKSETDLLDVDVETAQSLAAIDEHTAAIQVLQGLGELLHLRIAPDDPRVVWHWAHEAWVRRLAGDRITTEQLLEGAPDWLARELGDAHPYTRSARLSLADVLDERGAHSDATALRTRADAATRQLFHQDVPVVSPGVPPAPGVIAHVSPNSPIREGFRRGRSGGYYAPLTSLQRLNAGRAGWQLYIVARDSCRVAVVVGIQPRRVSAALVKAARGWDVQIEGVAPRMVLASAATDAAVVSLSAGASGDVAASFAEQSASSRLAPTDPTLVPPYALTFDGETSADACAVVWMAIPFPFAPTGR